LAALVGSYAVLGVATPRLTIYSSRGKPNGEPGLMMVIPLILLRRCGSTDGA